MVVNYIGRANGEVFEDTYARGKPIVFFFGGRPFSGGMCQGVEQALAGMKAGGKRRVVSRSGMGFMQCTLSASCAICSMHSLTCHVLVKMLLL